MTKSRVKKRRESSACRSPCLLSKAPDHLLLTRRSSLSPTKQTVRFNEAAHKIFRFLRPTTPAMMNVLGRLHEAQLRIGKNSPPKKEQAVVIKKTLSVNNKRFTYYLIQPSQPCQEKKEPLLFLDGDAWLQLNASFRESDWRKFADYFETTLILPILPAISEDYSLDQRRQDLISLIKTLIEEKNYAFDAIIGYSSGASDALSLLNASFLTASLSKFFLVAPALEIPYLECQHRQNSFFEIPTVISKQSIKTGLPSDSSELVCDHEVTIFAFKNDTFLAQQDALASALEKKKYISHCQYNLLEGSHSAFWADQSSREAVCDTIRKRLNRDYQSDSEIASYNLPVVPIARRRTRANSM